jgi:hypothetical protein
MRADRWTDITKLIVTFCNFAEAPKKEVKHIFACHVNVEYELILSAWL